MTTTIQHARAVFVRAGDDSTAWLVRGNGIDVDLCTCRQSVYADGVAAPVLGPLAVTETIASGGFDWFAARLSPAQTAALNATTETLTLTWVVEVIGGVSVTPAYNREQHRKLHVLPQLLPAA